MDCDGINQIVSSLDVIKDSLEWITILLVLILLTQCGCICV
jgi:hypothetical protein